jgi:hypothetical protein
MALKSRIYITVLFFSFTLGLTGGAWAGGPQLKVTEPSHDFGEAAEGEVVSHEFILQNTGTEALQIADVRPG